MKFDILGDAYFIINKVKKRVNRLIDQDFKEYGNVQKDTIEEVKRVKAKSFDDLTKIIGGQTHVRRNISPSDAERIAKIDKIWCDKYHALNNRKDELSKKLKYWRTQRKVDAKFKSIFKKKNYKLYKEVVGELIQHE